MTKNMAEPEEEIAELGEALLELVAGGLRAQGMDYGD